MQTYETKHKKHVNFQHLFELREWILNNCIAFNEVWSYERLRYVLGTGGDMLVIGIPAGIALYLSNIFLFPGWRFTIGSPLSNILIGVCLLVCGVVLYGAFIRMFRSFFSTNRLCTSGIFHVIRHPLYTAMILFIVPGIVVLFQWPLGLAIPPILAVIFHYRIGHEEEKLVEMFGDAYREYRDRTARLIPYIY